MSGPDALHGEMPGFPFPGRPGGEHDEPLLDMIFGGRAIPPDAPPEMYDLARMLAAAAGPVEPGELAGEAAARAAFRFASPARISPATAPPARRRPRWSAPARLRRSAPARLRRPAPRAARRAARNRARLAAALVVVAAGLGSVAAAYAGVLPGPIQHIAHVAVGAPDRGIRLQADAAAPVLDTNGRPRPADQRTAAPGHPASAASGQANLAQPLEPNATGHPGRRCPVAGGRDPASPSWRSSCCPGSFVPGADHRPAHAHGRGTAEFCGGPVRARYPR
jgi:hypothetical protein